MKWQVEWLKPAIQDLRQLDRSLAMRVIEKVDWLAEHCDQVRHEPLHGKWTGHFKLRIGDW